MMIPLQKAPFVALLLLCLLWLDSCQSRSDAEQIIDKAITAHGGEQYNHAHMAFDLRDRHYVVTLEQGKFVYESMYTDSIGQVHNLLTNEGFRRTVNEQPVALSEEDSIKYANSLNSVVYFALLPYFLNDPSANKELLGQDTVAGEPYYEIRVTFDQQGGGKDHDDEFVYWIHQQHFTMDYLAYSFHVDGGGTRFREAYNTRGINGIRFADYINYEATADDFQLQDYDQLLEEGKVKELSRIRLENVTVENIPIAMQ